MKHEFQVRMTCTGCTGAVTKALKATPGSFLALYNVL
jgi:copper chaperone CopZ